MSLNNIICSTNYPFHPFHTSIFECSYISPTLSPRFSIITGCWRFGSEERPTFSNLVLEISSVLKIEAGYLDLSLPLIRRENEDTEDAVLNESTHKVTVKNNLESKF